MRARTITGQGLTPGVNVDAVNVAAGLSRAEALGYTSGQHQMEVEYNLMRWARGEEGAADRSMSQSLSGVAYTDWRVILAAAIVARSIIITRQQD